MATQSIPEGMKRCTKCGETKALTEYYRHCRLPDGRIATCIVCFKRDNTERFAWRSARARCHNPRSQAYKWYGARGITMCERWRDSFDAFLADMGRCPDGQTLDRLDNDGPYSPDNCAWRTYTEQNNNTRANRRITIDGVTQTLTQWAREKGVAPTTIHSRVTHGRSIIAAVTDPLTPRRLPLTFRGETRLMTEWAEIMGMGFRRVSQRLKRGWSVERALTEQPAEWRVRTGRQNFGRAIRHQ